MFILAPTQMRRGQSGVQSKSYKDDAMQAEIN